MGDATLLGSDPPRPAAPFPSPCPRAGGATAGTGGSRAAGLPVAVPSRLSGARPQLAASPAPAPVWPGEGWGERKCAERIEELVEEQSQRHKAHNSGFSPRPLALDQRFSSCKPYRWGRRRLGASPSRAALRVCTFSCCSERGLRCRATEMRWDNSGLPQTSLPAQL